MAYLNEVDPATVAQWLQNFNNCPNNIYQPFQKNTINLPRKIYDILSNNSVNHINIYFGYDESLNPKIIALGSYMLDQLDGEEQEGFVDILDPEKIYELYSASVVPLATAQQYIDKWKQVNETSSLFKVSFLSPRPNYIQLFLNDQANPVRIFFGMDNNNEPKMMQKDPNAGSGAVVFDKTTPCPPICGKQSII